jgi:Inner membrane protein CreD
MSTARLVAIVFIYLCAAVAWGLLGGSLMVRTGESDARLSREVALLWGGTHVQVAPHAAVQRPRTVSERIQDRDAQGQTVTREVTKQMLESVTLPLDRSRVQVSLHLDQRKKGLLWYDTYAVRFAGKWRVRNPDAAQRRLVVRFAFPSADAIYDEFAFRVGGVDTPNVSDLSRGVEVGVDVPAGGEVPIEVAYRSRGLGDWTYAFAREGVSPVRDFELVMTTDFAAIDFPAGTMSPTSKNRDGDGWRLTWRFGSLVTGQRIGMDLPDRLNLGPLAARITWFTPVGLLFFLTVMVILGVLRGHNLHPMNYAFVCAAFFAFHLLLAYLVDHLDIHLSFAIAAVTSVALVVSYLRVVAGSRAALLEAALAQVVFLVLFSYAFFFEGYTGLTVTIGAIITLFVLMQMTARVDWAAVFARRQTA